MEKNNNGKVVAIVALVVAVVALSVGFAAFADDLTIDGTANVSGANAFDDALGKGLEYDGTTPACVKTGTNTSVATTPYSAGTASGDVWSGIKVPLTPTDKSVTCTATVNNYTAYTAYLKSIATTTGLSCSSTGANATTNASNVCAETKVTVQIGSVAADKIEITNAAANNSSTTGSIAAGTSQNPGTATVTVTIEYEGTAVADEDVVVTIPTITHHYSSAS